MKSKFHFPENPRFVVFWLFKHGFLNFVSQMGHYKFIVTVDFNIYENRVLLPRKPKFGSFLTLKHVFLYFVS